MYSVENGVKTMSSAWTTQVTNAAFDILSALTATAIGTIPCSPLQVLTFGSTGLNVTRPVQYIADPSQIPAVVKELKKQKSDAFSGIYATSSLFLSLSLCS